MTNELFIRVTTLDEMINEAADNGDEIAEQKYYDEQEQIMAQIEELGLRNEFDAYIKSMN